MEPLMDFIRYQEEAARTLARRRLDEYTPAEMMLKLATMGLGVAGEAGEVADLIKKYVGHGHELDDDKLLKEMGDVLWYLAAIATLRGFSLEQVAALNISKLRARYPEGFSEEASRNRKA